MERRRDGSGRLQRVGDIGVQRPPGDVVEVARDTGPHLSGAGHPAADDRGARQPGARVAGPLRGECGVEERPDPPGIDVLGIVVGGHALQGGSDPDADDHDAVLGQQDVAGIEDQVVDPLDRCSGEGLGHRCDDEPRLITVQGRHGQPLAERRTGQPTGHHEDPTVVLRGVDDAQQAWMLDGGGTLGRSADRVGVRVSRLRGAGPPPGGRGRCPGRATASDHDLVPLRSRARSGRRDVPSP